MIPELKIQETDFLVAGSGSGEKVVAALSHGSCLSFVSFLVLLMQLFSRGGNPISATTEWLKRCIEENNHVDEANFLLHTSQTSQVSSISLVPCHQLVAR